MAGCAGANFYLIYATKVTNSHRRDTRPFDFLSAVGTSTKEEEEIGGTRIDEGIRYDKNRSDGYRGGFELWKR